MKFEIQKYFFSELKNLRAGTKVDWVEYVAVPVGFELPRPLYYKSGTYKYSRKWFRDERTRVIPIPVNSAWLIGTLSRDDKTIKNFDSLNLNGAEEASDFFFGCKTWAKYLSVENINMAFDGRFKPFAKLWRDNGLRAPGCFAFFYLVKARDLNVNDWQKIIILKKESVKNNEIIDIVTMLNSLKIELKDAKQLYKAHQKGKSTTLVVDDVVVQFRPKNIRQNLHDFLVSIDEKLAQTKQKNLHKVELKQVWRAPEGFSYVNNLKKLVEVSKKNGWCASNSYYTEAALVKKVEFFFHEKEKVLACYDTSNGVLKEQKAAWNKKANLASSTLVRVEI